MWWPLSVCGCTSTHLYERRDRFSSTLSFQLHTLFQGKSEGGGDVLLYYKRVFWKDYYYSISLHMINKTLPSPVNVEVSIYSGFYSMYISEFLMNFSFILQHDILFDCCKAVWQIQAYKTHILCMSAVRNNWKFPLCYSLQRLLPTRGKISEWHGGRTSTSNEW